MENMLPEFRAGNYDAGMIAGVNRVVSILREEPVTLPPRETIDWGAALPAALAVYILLVLASLFWVNSSVNEVKKNPNLKTNLARYNALKAKKSIVILLMAFFVPMLSVLAIIYFFGAHNLLFVVPMPFLVIFANNIYGKKQLKKIREQPIPCDACNGTMHILLENEGNKYLNAAQQLEKKLGSMDYDVFLCDKCKQTRVFALDKPSVYTKCPKCGTKAMSAIGKRRLVAPTYTSEGVEQTTFKCKFCGHEEHKNTKIPRLQRTNNAALAGAVVAGSMLGGRGGGGGFGGRGGGSFGGGRTSGGGAGMRW
jgi:uncharacterized protein